MKVHYNDAFVQKSDEWMTRRLLAHHNGMMILHIHFHKATDDPGLHTHPHEQLAYVQQGRIEFIVDGKSAGIFEPGDSIYFEPNSIHGGKPLVDDTIILDIFTPQRQDFLPPAPK